MQQQTQIINNSDFDDALIQCLRIFARHGRKVRAERQSVGVLQKNIDEKSFPEKELKINPSHKSS